MDGRGREQGGVPHRGGKEMNHQRQVTHLQHCLNHHLKAIKLWWECPKPIRLLWPILPLNELADPKHYQLSLLNHIGDCVVFVSKSKLVRLAWHTHESQTERAEPWANWTCWALTSFTHWGRQQCCCYCMHDPHPHLNPVYLFWCYLFAWLFLRTLHKNCTSPTNHLANNYFVNIGVNHGVRSWWPLPSPLPGQCPKYAHWRNPHTMGDHPSAWFGRCPGIVHMIQRQNVTRFSMPRYWWCHQCSNDITFLINI